MISCLLNSPCAHCKNQKPGNAILLLRTHLWLPSTFRRKPSSLSLGLSSHCSALSPPATLWLRCSPQSFQTSKFTILISHQAVALFLNFTYFVATPLRIIPPPLCLAKSFSTFRKLKHHLFQKAFPEFPSWSQNAPHLFAPKVVVLLQ